jgi:MoxR-like ATPase
MSKLVTKRLMLLQISKKSMSSSNNRLARPSPSVSAAQTPVGTTQIGNDGRLWQVKQFPNGVNRWVPLPAPPQGFFASSAVQAPLQDTGNQQVQQVQQEVKPIEPIMSKTKANRKPKTQEVRTIDTSLINKEEVFKMLALAEASGLPCLLVGPPGVGKTKTVMDYAKAWLNKDGNLSAKDFAEKIYILETDEGTKPSEIKGMPDIESLFTENKFELSTPIAEAEIVVINEVDKASPAIRNAMLGVMNEKFLFNGKHKIPCKWKLFIATCNEIPKEEKNNPFWDRFMLKMTVNRVTVSEINQYYRKGDRDYREQVVLNIPNKQEMADLQIPANKLSKYLEVGYSVSSDRTLTFVPRIAKAVSYVWDCTVDQALVKTAQIMINQAAGSALQDRLLSAEKKIILGKIDLLNSYKTNDELEKALAEIETLINGFVQKGTFEASDVTEVDGLIRDALSKHPARKDYVANDDFEDQMAQAQQDHDASMAMAAGPVDPNIVNVPF